MQPTVDGRMEKDDPAPAGVAPSDPNPQSPRQLTAAVVASPLPLATCSSSHDSTSSAGTTSPNPEWR
ncbi:hypothetical protein [Streptomyces sp. NPDC101776]|uniref:hypothetical protein n=1 Tax=Streptomyces sp. NPDC101776 TaxID=3366146 RepID=UPI003830B82A